MLMNETPTHSRSIRRFPETVAAFARWADESGSLCSYVGADPVNFTDPSGLARQCATVRVGGSREYTADGGVIVTLRLAEVCWDDGRGRGLEPGWSLGGSGGRGWPTPQGCHIPENCPNPQPRNPQPPKTPRCPAAPSPPASRNYSVPEGYTSAGYRNNLYVRNAQGKLVNNPLYDDARARAGGVDIGGVVADLGKIAGSAGFTVLRGVKSVFGGLGFVGFQGGKAGFDVIPDCNER